MKPAGSHLSYYEQRDSELYDAYKRVLPKHVSADGTTDFMGAIEEAVKTPCSRFWISEGVAYNKIRKLLACPDELNKMVGENKKQMYTELLRIFKEMRQDPLYADLTDRQIAYMASDHPAPEFYLTPGSAHIHICAERKRRLMQRLHIKK